MEKIEKTSQETKNSKSELIVINEGFSHVSGELDPKLKPDASLQDNFKNFMKKRKVNTIN